MKHIKKFENINNIPEIGDYVLLYDLTDYGIDSGDNFKMFINNNIGIVHDIQYNVFNHDEGYYVMYSNVPDNIRQFFKKINTNNVTLGNNGVTSTWFVEDFLMFSKNKKDIEVFLQSKKYNL